jgi:hypothetical protein
MFSCHITAHSNNQPLYCNGNFSMDDSTSFKQRDFYPSSHSAAV